MATNARRPGRPGLTTEPSADVHLRLAPKDYDKTYQLAKQRRESVQDVIRRGLKRLLVDERGA